MKTKKPNRQRTHRASPSYNIYINAGRVIIDLFAFLYLVILLHFHFKLF
jgi:hypothetical protein